MRGATLLVAEEIVAASFTAQQSLYEGIEFVLA